MSTLLRGWVFLLLVGFVTALTPLAYADLPDQTWLSGLYDGGNEDGAIDHITTNLVAVASPAPAMAPHSVLCSQTPLKGYPAVVAGPIRSAGPTRAPPLP